VGSVSVIAASFGEQARHFPRFVFKTPDQVSVFRVPRFIHQPDGNGFVFVTLVSGTFRKKSGDFLMLPREV
jgi:hypothetical protein